MSSTEKKSRNFYRYIKDRITGKAPKGAKRSRGWRKLRREFVKNNAQCAVCGTTKKLEVHHIIPFHIAPDLELDPANLITLCDGKGKYGSRSCHLLFGHLGNFQGVNANLSEDVQIWRARLQG